MKKIRYVYIAGPYRSGSPDKTFAQVIDAADAVARNGYIPFIPHTITWGWCLRKAHRDDFWLTYALRWVERCDALIRTPGPSRGADREMRKADEIGIPVFGTEKENGLTAFLMAHENGFAELEGYGEKIAGGKR